MDRLLELLHSVLGSHHHTSGDNYSYYCPFCNHHKRKLEVNIKTQRFHCWVCNTRGRTLKSLFKKLRVDSSKFDKLFSIVGNHISDYEETGRDREEISLPEEYKPLWQEHYGPEYKNAIAYCKRRGLTEYDIIKYRIGYCEEGRYAKRIVIPSYDETGMLNFFVTRGYYKAETLNYLNPVVDKDQVVGFDLYVNWNEPIILVEGPFDAIAVKRNAVPLFGKTISKALAKKIIRRKVSKVYICLDADARIQALDIAESFMNEGIEVYFVPLENLDPSELGFEKIIPILGETPELTMGELVKYRFNYD